MPWVEVGDTDIYYVEEGQGPPLVFLHGMSSCGEAWFQQLAAFRERFRVIAYDSVNHGHSSNSPREAEEPDRVDELEGFLEALGLERPVVAGNSMGANTLLRWAARHPDRATALIPSGSGVGDGSAAAQAAGGALAGRRGRPLDPETLLLPIGGALTDGFKQRETRMYERYLRIRSTATRIEALRHPRRPSAAAVEDRRTLHERVAAIRSPMLVVVGSLDAAVPRAEQLHKRVSGSEYVVIDGAPHNVYYEAAEPYNAAVADFLTRKL